MLVLTVKQPWAWAIIHGGKDIENRDWSTNVRGRVAIHASRYVDQMEYWKVDALEIPDLIWPPFSDLRGGVIIGTVEIVDCVTGSDSEWFVGEHGFVLRNPIALPEPIPRRGQLGFWQVPAEIEAQITAQEGT